MLQGIRSILFHILPYHKIQQMNGYFITRPWVQSISPELTALDFNSSRFQNYSIAYLDCHLTLTECNPCTCGLIKCLPIRHKADLVLRAKESPMLMEWLCKKAKSNAGGKFSVRRLRGHVAQSSLVVWICIFIWVSDAYPLHVQSFCELVEGVLI